MCVPRGIPVEFQILGSPLPYYTSFLDGRTWQLFYPVRRESAMECYIVVDSLRGPARGLLLSFMVSFYLCVS